MSKDHYIRLGLRQGWGGVESPFHISEEGLRRHLYVIGKTGTGKSSLLESLLLQIAGCDRGVAVLDPHGDLAEELLDLLPRRLARKVTYFNPADLSFPIAWNILANVPFNERLLVASGIVSAFKNVWVDSWGPRLEYILYNAIRALLDAEHTSILGLPKMLVDETYRRWVVRQVKDPFVKAFWQEEFDLYDQRFRQEAIAPIQNKIGQIVTNPMLRNVFGQAKKKLDIPFIMNSGRIFIANLSKGAIGIDPSNLIGSLLVSEFQRAAMQRGLQREALRRDFTLIIDEFQNFTTGAIETILSEARKFRLSLVLSHQFTSQLDPKIREAVFGNVGTTVAFQLGSTDAEIMSNEYAGAYAASHFVDLDRFNVLIKPNPIDGSLQPFRGRTEVVSIAPSGAKHSILRASRERYSSMRTKVEDKIQRWMQRWGQD